MFDSIVAGSLQLTAYSFLFHADVRRFEQISQIRSRYQLDNL